MNELGRLLLGAGILLCIAGAAVLLFAKAGLPLGRLPGDMTWRGRNWQVSFPLMTSLLLSGLLTLVLWIVGRFRQ